MFSRAAEWIEHLQWVERGGYLDLLRYCVIYIEKEGISKTVNFALRNRPGVTSIGR